MSSSVAHSSEPALAFLTLDIGLLLLGGSLPSVGVVVLVELELGGLVGSHLCCAIHYLANANARLTVLTSVCQLGGRMYNYTNVE